MSGADTAVQLSARTSAGVESVWRYLADPYSYGRWRSLRRLVELAEGRGR